MADIVYGFGGGLYINLTNRCSNSCDFCLRKTAVGIGETALWLEHEPTAEEVIVALERANFTRAKSVVFCGYGEPTEALCVLLEVARYAKDKGVLTRLNTNGLANLVYGVDIVPVLANVIDSVSVSLNASTPAKYEAICHSRYGLDAYPAMWAFARACRMVGLDVVMSVVDSIGTAEVEQCRALATAQDIPFKVRAYIENATQERATRLN